MKKHLLAITLLFAFVVATFAQVTPSLQLSTVPFNVPLKNMPSKSHNRNMTCGNDTLYYSYLKEVAIGASAFQLIPLVNSGTNKLTAFSQTFLATGSTTISGISFYGGVVDDINAAQTLSINVKVYDVNGTNKPTTMVATASASATVNTTIGFYNVNFSSPVTVPGNYAVVVENLSATDTLGVVANSATTTAPSYAEGLAYLYVTAAVAWYPTTAFPAPTALEGIIAPIVSYPVATDFTIASTPTAVATPVIFTNTTTTAGIVENRMYNYNTFNKYFNLASSDSTYVWDMGDASAEIWTKDATHSYAASGSYNVTLYTLGGFWNSCMDTKASTVVVSSATGISTNTENANLNIYPNPSTGIFNIETNSLSCNQIEVYNMIGELVFSKIVNSKTFNLDLSSLSEGVYSLKLTSNDKNSIQRIVIAK